MNSVVSVLVAVVLAVFLIGRRFQGAPVRLRRLSVLPLVLIVIGFVQISHEVHGTLPGKDLSLLVVSGLAALAIGAVRGVTVSLYERDGVLWQRYRAATLVAWIAAIAVRIGFVVLAHGVGAHVAGSESTLLLMLGLSFLGEGLVVLSRGRMGGIPIAAEARPGSVRGSSYDGERSRW